MIYDLLVIGGGSGGLACARRAAQHGAKVVLFEKSELGGTCVNLGCVPKKLTFNAANLFHSISRDLEPYCIEPTNQLQYKFNWLAFKKKRDSYIHWLNEKHGENLEKDGVVFVKKTVETIDPVNKIVNCLGESFRGEKILIATGSHPNLPQDTPGWELGGTSDDFFRLEKQPKRVAIIGSGYIAVELAGIFNALGTEVAIYCRQDHILTHFDHEVACFLQGAMEKQGIKIYKTTAVKKLEKHKDFINIVYEQVRLEKNSSNDCCYDFVLWAIGRGPNVPQLTSKLIVDSAGHLQVSKWQETSATDVYAIGDVTGQLQLTPVAIAAGRALADRLFGGKSESHLDYTNIPSVIFSHPPLASIGHSEEAAREIYGSEKVTVYRSTFRNLYESLLNLQEREETFYKMVCVDEKIVGLFLVGRGSDEAMQGFAVAVKMGASRSDFLNTVAIHPTASEETLTLK